MTIQAMANANQWIFKPNIYKSAYKMLIYGPILTIQSSTESLKSAWSYGRWISLLLSDTKSW